MYKIFSRYNLPVLLQRYEEAGALTESRIYIRSEAARRGINRNSILEAVMQSGRAFGLYRRHRDR